MRGRLTLFTLCACFYSGSPPRMRGRRSDGATRSGVVCGSPPRMRGRLFLRDIRFVLFDGSPPRMRGRRPAQYRGSPPSPVHPRVCGADRSCSIISIVGIKTVHPRVCGADTGRCFARGHSRPVHPRVCGADELTVGAEAATARFTPAYAGQTLLCFRGVQLGSTVHPRVCGADA